MRAESNQSHDRSRPSFSAIFEATGPNTCVVRVRGQLDAGTRAAAREALARVIAEALSWPNLAIVVLDLAEVPFADSDGLGVLILVEKALRERGVTLGVSGCSPQVARVLKLTQLDRLIDVLP